MHLPRLRAVAGLAVALSILAVGCGDDGESADPDATTTTEAAPADTTTTAEATSTTAVAYPEADESSTTTAAPTTSVVTGDPLTSGSVTNAEGVRVDWELTGDTTTLCFDVAVDDPEPDPEQALAVAPDVAACITPDGGLDALDDPLSVSIGRVDGAGAFGYLWGRVEPEIDTVDLAFVDGTRQTVELVDGPTDVRVFAVVVDTAAGPEIDSIDALSGTRVEHSVRVGGFVRSGPAYPVVTPIPTVAPVEYPEAGG